MSLGSGKGLFDDEHCTGGTHRAVPFLAFYHDMMDIGNHSVGVCDITLDVGDDGVGSHDIMANLGNGGIGSHDIVKNARNCHVCIYCKLGLGVWLIIVTQKQHRYDRTYVEDMKDLVEVRLPGGDHFFIILCVEKSSECIPFAFLDDLPLDLRQGAAIGSIVNKTSRTDRRWAHSPRQLVNRRVHRVTKVFRQLPVQSPLEGGTDVSAGQREFDVVLLVGHRFLYIFY